MTSRPLDSEPLAWMAIMSPHTTPSRPGIRHTVFTVENKGMGGEGQKYKRKTHSTEKSRQPLTHRMSFKATTESAQSMCRTLLPLTTMDISAVQISSS